MFLRDNLSKNNTSFKKKLPRTHVESLKFNFCVEVYDTELLWPNISWLIYEKFLQVLKCQNKLTSFYKWLFIYVFHRNLLNISLNY